MSVAKHLLLIDDELGTRESLRVIFCKQYRVSAAASGREALEIVAKDRPDLVLLDVLLQDVNGLDLLRDLRSRYPNLPVIIVSAVNAVPKVVEAMQNGAYDYITKPFDVHDIQNLVARGLECSALRSQLEVLQDEVTREFPTDGVVGKAPSFRNALDEVRKAAQSDATVLICGESGTGKELAARMLHDLSNRRAEPFVPVHCAGIPESLIESELFGHEKGAFTGAHKQKLGRFDLAGSGTLFFDEVSEMSLAVQAKLLRVLEEREFTRVGGTKVIKTTARLVAACNRDLRQLVRDHRFREDLYYRLSVVPIHLPPLRERRDDIPLLACFFLARFRQDMRVAATEFAPETLQALAAYAWPGNIRELRNVIERMLVLHGAHPVLRPEHLPGDLGGVPPASGAGAGEPPAKRPLAEAIDAQEKELIVNALRDTGGNQTRAADLLGTTRRILKYRMEKFGLDSTTFER